MNRQEITQITKNSDHRIMRRMIGAVAFCLFFVISYCVITGKTSGFDDPIRDFFYSIRSDGLTPIAIGITYLSDAKTMIGLCILLLIIPWTRLRFGVPLSAGALVTVGVNHMIKDIVERARPDVLHLVAETGHSFPSGHSINSMFFYGLSIWLVIRYVPSAKARHILIPLLAIPMLLVGLTRIYLGVHYPTDVIAGWCLAIVAAVLAIEIILLVDKKAERP